MTDENQQEHSPLLREHKGAESSSPHPGDDAGKITLEEKKAEKAKPRIWRLALNPLLKKTPAADDTQQPVDSLDGADKSPSTLSTSGVGLSPDSIGVSPTFSTTSTVTHSPAAGSAAGSPSRASTPSDDEEADTPFEAAEEKENPAGVIVHKPLPVAAIAQQSKFEIVPSHVDHLKDKSSSNAVKKNTEAVVTAIDPFLTLDRVGDQRFFALLGIGDKNGPLTRLAGTNVPVALAVMYWAFAAPAVNLYLAHKESQHAEYSSNPLLLLKFLEGFLEQAENQSAKEVDGLCLRIQGYFDELFYSNPAFQEKYESLRFNYSKTKDGPYQFYISLAEKEKPDPAPQSQSVTLVPPSLCNLFWVPDASQKFESFIRQRPAYVLTPTGLFYLHTTGPREQSVRRALIAYKEGAEDKKNPEKSKQAKEIFEEKSKQVRKTFGISDEVFEKLKKTKTKYSALSSDISSQQQEAITRLTDHSLVPCFLYDEDGAPAGVDYCAYILEKKEGHYTLLYKAKGREQGEPIKSLSERQAELIKTLIRKSSGEELTATRLLQITAMTGHHPIPKPPRPKTLFQEVTEWADRKPQKTIFSFLSHAYALVFTAFLLFWLAWMSGTKVTGVSTDLIIPGVFGISVTFVLALPVAIAFYIYGKKLFNWLEHHYQFGNDLHLLDKLPPNDGTYRNCYVCVGLEKDLYYFNNKGESAEVFIGNREKFNGKLAAMKVGDSKYFSQEQLEQLITQNGGQLQPGAPTWISRKINYEIWKGRGFFPLAGNAIVSFVIGLFLLNPLSLIIIGVGYAWKGVDKEKEHVLSAGAQTDMVAVFRGSGVLAQYDAAAQKISSVNGREPELKSRPLTDPVPPVPPVTVPGKGAIARQFWLTFIIRASILEFLAWFFMAIVAYATRDPTGGSVVEYLVSNTGALIIGGVFLAVSFVYTVFKTWDWYNTQKADADKLNDAPGRDIEAAEVNYLKARLVEAQTDLMLWQAQYRASFQVANSKVTGEALEQALAQDPNYNSTMVDASDPSNLENLKDPTLPPVLIERMVNGAYAVGLTTLLAVFADALFPGRNLFLATTGESTSVIQMAFDAILTPLGIGPMSSFASLVLIGLTVGYAFLHTVLRMAQKKADATHTKIKQQRELAPLQITCLQKQIQVLEKQQIALKVTRPSVLPSSASCEVDPESKKSVSPAAKPSEAAHLLGASAPMDSSLSFSDLYPDAELSNSTIEKNNRHSRVYLLAWLALAGMFGLFAVSFAPAFLVILPSKLILTICVPIVVVGILALLKHLNAESPILSPQEKSNTKILAFGLVLSLVSLAFIYAQPALASASYVFLILPALVTAVLFATNFQKETDGIVYAKEFLTQWEDPLKEIIASVKTGATWLTPEQKQRLEYALDAVIMAMNPNDKGQALDASKWPGDDKRIGEKELLLNIKHLQRIRERVHNHEALSREDALKIENTFKRFRACPLLAPDAISQLPQKTSAAMREKVDIHCTVFVLILAAVGVILPAALGVQGAGQVALAVLIPFFVFLKLLVEHAKIDKNYLEEDLKKNEWLTKILVVFALILCISAFILPFWLAFPLLAQILLPIIAMAATPVFLKLFLDACGCSAETMRDIKSGISKALSPRLLTQVVLSLLLLGAGVSSIVAIALMVSSPFSNALLFPGLLFAASWMVTQLSHRYLKVVFDAKALPVASPPEAEDNLSIKAPLAAVWTQVKSSAWRLVSVLSSPTLSRFFLLTNLGVLSLLALGLPVISALLLLNVIAAPAMVGVMVVSCALPLTFFILKVLLPKALIALQVNGSAGNPDQNAKLKDQIEKGWKYAAYTVSIVLFLTAAILYSTTSLPAHFLMITGVWLVGLIGVEVSNYYSRYKNEGKVDPSTLWPAAEVAVVGDNTGATHSVASSAESAGAVDKQRGASVGSDTSASGSRGSVGSDELQEASSKQGTPPSSPGQSRQGSPGLETGGVLPGARHLKLPLPAQGLQQGLKLPPRSISDDNLSSQTAESKAKASGKLPSPTRGRTGSVPSDSRDRLFGRGESSPRTPSSGSYTPPSATDTPSSSSGSPYMTGSPVQGKA